MRTINVTSTARKNVQKNDLTAQGNFLEMNDGTFRDMFEHIRPLLSRKDGTSEWQIKDYFHNLRVEIVEQFISMAIRRGIIRKAFGTYTLG